jgi:putative ABC transport system ATP-binding protein
MIRTESLVKVFHAEDIETNALNGLELTVAKGEFVAVMGPSGCGKSTLLNILGLLDSPTSGRHFFLDEDVSRYNEKQRAKVRKERIGFIFQNYNLIDELNVYENIELPLIYLGAAPGERKRRVNEMLERFMLVQRQKVFPLQLSGGQQQQVAVARALIINPLLILADEPTGNLDSKRGAEIMDLLANLNGQGTTIIMVTHSQRDAEYSGRIVNMFDGRIVNQRY